MTQAFNDAYKIWLQNRVATNSSSIKNLERDFLMSELTLTSPLSNKYMWRTWLIAQGATGTTTSDLWYDYLGGLGYTGSLRRRQRDYWEAG